MFGTELVRVHVLCVCRVRLPIMDKVASLLLLCVSIFCTDAVQLTIFGPKKNLVKVGDSISFTAHVNQGFRWFLRNYIGWTFLPFYPLSDSPAERVKVTDFKNHDFKFNISDSDINATIILPKGDVQDIAMTFDGERTITGVDPNPLEREEGEYGVSCQASGFSPSATIAMFVGDQQLKVGKPDTKLDIAASKAAQARRYTVRVTASNVELKAKNMGDLLRCEAYANIANRVTKTASVPLKICLVPTVVCDNNVIALPGDEFVELYCIVYHSNVETKDYIWKIGDTSVIIEPGELSEVHDEVIVQELGDHRTKVTLNLHKVSDWHFDSFYYLDVYTKSDGVCTKSDQKFRTKTFLNKSSTSDAPSLTASKLVLFVMCFLFSSLRFHH